MVPSLLYRVSAVSWPPPVTVYDFVCDPLVAYIGDPPRLAKLAVRSSQMPLLLQVMLKLTLSPAAKPTMVLLLKPPAETLNPPVFTASQPADASASRFVPQTNAPSARSNAKKVATERVGATQRVLQHGRKPISPNSATAVLIGRVTSPSPSVKSAERKKSPIVGLTIAPFYLSRKSSNLDQSCTRLATARHSRFESACGFSRSARSSPRI